MSTSQIILAINAGSSSVKITVYEVANHKPRALAEAQVSGLTAPPARLKYQGSHATAESKEVKDIHNQADACDLIIEHLVNDAGLHQVPDRESITHICHRVVHGGDYGRAVVIDREKYHHIEELTDLAPLHNASALAIIRACTEALPRAKNIAFFDSAFHQTIPEAIRTYAIDPTVAQRNQLRKYGFHGISYAFILDTAVEHMKWQREHTNLIVLHLGSGASVCAIRDGQSLDTSMGLTPLDGLPGATRSGSVDPSLIFHFTHDAGKPSSSSTKDLHISTAEEILNTKSGWKALTGTTDFGTIAASDTPACKLAYALFVDRIVGFIGSYYVKLEGRVDALVFAGGIGEKAAGLRAAVVEKVRCLGFELDPDLNATSSEGTIRNIGAAKAKHLVMVCETDEQYEMAKQCLLDPTLIGD